MGTQPWSGGLPVQKNANADWVHVRMKMMDFKAPHAAPLIAYADRVAEASGLQPGQVPYPDPEHGGTNAEVLFILSHPGEQAIRERGGSGLLSLENSDYASANCFDHCERVGLRFDRITHWNAVPQPLPKGKDPTQPQIRAGAQWLPGLLELLPHLRTVVLLGRNAERAWHEVFTEGYLTPVRGPSPGRQGMANRDAANSLGATFDEIMVRLETPVAG
jgi:hypothetical protein